MKDRTSQNVFKGSLLVSSLLEHYPKRFGTRRSAQHFAQSLLQAGHVESVLGERTFTDGCELYRWTDESVVEDARRIVTTPTGIPRKKLLELVDLHPLGSRDDLTPDDSSERTARRTPEQVGVTSPSGRGIDRSVRRNTIGTPTSSGAARERSPSSSYTEKMAHLRSNLNRSASMSTDRIAFKSELSVKLTPDGTANQREVRNNNLRNFVRNEQIAKKNVYNRNMYGSAEVLHPRTRGLVSAVARRVEVIPDGNDGNGSNHGDGNHNNRTPNGHSNGGVNGSSVNGNYENMYKSDCKVYNSKTPSPGMDYGERRRGSGSSNISSLAHPSLENINDGSYCFSDNEKHLLEQMKRMQKEHQNLVKSYEDKINELMGKMYELRNIAEMLENCGSQSSSPSSPAPPMWQTKNIPFEDLHSKCYLSYICIHMRSITKLCFYDLQLIH